MINDKELNFASSGQDDAKYGSLKTGKRKNNNKLKTTQ